MSDEIMAVDVMNYPYTPQGMKKFWSSAEMQEMCQRVLGGHTPQGVSGEQFIADMDDAGFEKVFVLNFSIKTFRFLFLST